MEDGTVFEGTSIGSTREGLNFDEEEAKYQAKKAETEAKARAKAEAAAAKKAAREAKKKK